MYKLSMIALLLIMAGLCSGLIYTRMQLRYLQGQYNDFVTLTDAAMNRHSAILLDNTCFDQLTSSDMIQIKILR